MTREVIITQESIERTSDYMLNLSKNENKTQEVLQIWTSTEQSCESDKRRLALFYLANDFVQKSQAGKDNQALLKAFPKVMDTVGAQIYKRIKDPEIRGKVDELLNLWIDRKIYSESYIQKIRDSIKAELEKPEEPKKKSNRVRYNVRAFATYLDQLEKDKKRMSLLESEINVLMTKKDDKQKEDLEKKVSLYERILTQIRCNRRYLFQILGTLGQEYRSAHSARLTKIGEIDTLLEQMEKAKGHSDMEVDT